jgi:hypothetical protein
MHPQRKPVGFEVAIDFPQKSSRRNIRVKFSQNICSEPKGSGKYPINLATNEQVADFDRKTPEYDGRFAPAAMALGNSLIEDGTNGVLSVDAVSPRVIEVTYNSDLVDLGRLMDRMSQRIYETNQSGWPPNDSYASV